MRNLLELARPGRTDLPSLAEDVEYADVLSLSNKMVEELFAQVLDCASMVCVTPHVT